MFLQDTGRQGINSKWQLEIKRDALARGLTLIKARMASDPYVKNNCVVLEEQIPLYNNGPAIALFDCLAALDGSAANTQSFTTFIITKLVKQSGENCLLEVISHNHAVL